MTPLARKTMFAALPVVLVVAYVTVPGLADGGGAILNAYNLSAGVSATVLIVAVALGRPRPLLPWLLIAAAVLLWVIGDVVYDWVGGDPIVSFADAFYVPEATMAQRIVRGKAKIREAQIPYVVPSLGDLPERLDAVLSAIYLVTSSSVPKLPMRCRAALLSPAASP